MLRHDMHSAKEGGRAAARAGQFDRVSVIVVVLVALWRCLFALIIDATRRDATLLKSKSEKRTVMPRLVRFA